MQNFQERLSPTIQVRALLTACPYIILSRKALDKMYTYVNGCTDEIGWLGTATRDGREIYINDVFLFDQEVHATTTEITPEGLSDFAMELLQKEDGMDVWNNMKVWGHSHVNMGVTPSGQDDSQMATFKEGGHDWFIRLIANKKGDLKIDLYEYTNGVIYLDLPWEAEIEEQEENVVAQIALLEEQLQLLRVESMSINTVGIDEEMKVKVRKKSYNTQVHTSNWASRGTIGTTSTETISEKKTNVPNVDANVQNGSAIVVGEDFFTTDDEVLEELGMSTLLEIASCFKFDEATEILLEYGYFDCFTDDDVERVMRVAKKTYWSLGGQR